MKKGGRSRPLFMHSHFLLEKKFRGKIRKVKEKKIIEFFIPLKKVPSLTHQNGIKVNFKTKNIYKSQELIDLENLFLGHLYPFVPDEPLRAPIRLVVKWLYKTNDKKKFSAYKITKPDTDNLLKTLKDCMAICGFFKNDSHVASEINEKFYNNISGIYIFMEEIIEDK